MLRVLEIETQKVCGFVQRIASIAARKSVASAEPAGIHMKHSEKSVSAILKNDMNHMSSTDGLQFFVDYKASQGNYIVDAEGNTILDMTAGGGMLPLGYNHQDFRAHFGSKSWDSFLSNASSNSTPSTKIPELIHSAFIESAPKGLKKVNLFDDITGSNAIEHAFKSAIFETGRSDIVSFSGSHHGNSIAALSLSSHHQKIDLPTFPWSIIDFPENSSEESRALESLEESLRSGNVAAIVLSPLQSQTFKTASNSFYEEAASLAHKNGAKVIVDESHTGVGATGHYWAHENWNLQPDFVTFGRKAQVSGVWSNESSVRNNSHIDAIGLIKHEIVNGAINADNLLEQVNSTATSFRRSLENVAGVSNVDGRGTLLAFDVESSEVNAKVQKYFRENGVAVNGAGPKRISVTPSLVFETKHADEFVGVLQKALR